MALTIRSPQEPLSREKLSGLDVFSTCPASSEVGPGSYLEQVIDVARWSEAWGCTGILVDAHHSLADPWLIAHTIIRHTRRLCPLVAVRPFYMHPYSVAKMVATLDYLYNRRVFLIMVPGGFTNDLAARDDSPSYDKRFNRLLDYTSRSTADHRRYDRLVEYGEVVKKLLTSDVPFVYHGEFYSVHRIKLAPAPPPELFPGIFVWSTSEAGVRAAAELSATVITYPGLAAVEKSSDASPVTLGLRVGILAREDPEQAWKVAHERFPRDRRGHSSRQIDAVASEMSTSAAVATLPVEKTPYWRGAFNRYHQTMCPYLVGSYEHVAAEIRRYVQTGCRTFIFDVPPNPDELGHLARVFGRVGSGSGPGVINEQGS